MCTCPIRLPIQRVQDKLVEFVKSVTLAELADAHCGCPPEESTPAERVENC